MNLAACNSLFPLDNPDPGNFGANNIGIDDFLGGNDIPDVALKSDLDNFSAKKSVHEDEFKMPDTEM